MPLFNRRPPVPTTTPDPSTPPTEPADGLWDPATAAPPADTATGSEHSPAPALVWVAPASSSVGGEAPTEGACTQADCAQPDVVPCAYADRRARQCPTHWCSLHGQVVGDSTYCRRHAGIIRALRAAGDTDPLPDLDNRAPSLAEWVGADLDAAIRAELGPTINAHVGAQLTVDPLATVPLGQGRLRVRCWLRSWKVFDHTGILRRVDIRVEEPRPDEVCAVVDHNPVMTVVPPWIRGRLSGHPLEELEDRTARAAFHESVALAIRDAIADSARRESAI